MWLECAPLCFLNNRIENQIASLHHAAAQHDPFNIQEVNNAGDAGANVFPGAFNHHQRKIVAFLCFARHARGKEIENADRQANSVQLLWKLLQKHEGNT